MRRVIALLVGTALAVGACTADGDRPAPSAHRVGPAVVPAEWRPWVLESVDTIAIPPAPGDASQPGRVQRPLVGEWLKLAMEYVAARSKNPPAASRAYAYVSAAAHDAMLVAAQAQRTSGSSVYPSIPATVAGAAARTLAHLFPEQSALRLDERARDAGTQAGAGTGLDGSLAIGWAVSDVVIARARSDGAGRVWDGSRPANESRNWSPPPGSVSPPIEPLAGSWRTWVLPSGDALRPPPPPEFGSPAFMDEANELIQIGKSLTPKQRAAAKHWEGGEGTALPPGVWITTVLGYLVDHDVSDVLATRTLAALTIAMADAGVASWDAKYAYWYPRPENAIRATIDAGWRPFLRTPVFPAYTSGSSTYGSAAGEVLAAIFPDDARHFRELGEEQGMSRLWGGIHWRSDHSHGSRMGQEIGRRVAATLT